MQQKRFIDLQDQLNMFRAFFAYLQERKTVPRCRSPDPDLLQHQDTIPHAVKLSLTLLKMGKKLAETCSAELENQ